MSRPRRPPTSTRHYFCLVRFSLPKALNNHPFWSQSIFGWWMAIFRTGTLLFCFLGFETCFFVFPPWASQLVLHARPASEQGLRPSMPLPVLQRIANKTFWIHALSISIIRLLFLLHWTFTFNKSVRVMGVFHECNAPVYFWHLYPF